MRKYSFALATAGLIGLAATQSIAAPSSADKTFAQKAAAGGSAEVALGQLAQQNAASPQVKQFGQRMVSDHTQANQELMQIAQQQNITLSSEPDPKEQAEQKRFAALKGAQFDTAYTQHEVSDHKKDIADFEREAKSGQDPALKAFAQKTLPILREHLQMAQSAASTR